MMNSCASDEWMPQLQDLECVTNWDPALNYSNVHCVDPIALPGIAPASESFDTRFDINEYLPFYSDNEKTYMVGKPLKDSTDHFQRIKQVEEYAYCGQALSNNPSSIPAGPSRSCKLNLAMNPAMNGSDAKQVPSLRLNYDGCLNSWPSNVRDLRWLHDSYPRFVYGNPTENISISDDIGPRSDIDLVPAGVPVLNNAECGIDGVYAGVYAHKYPTALFQGYSPGSVGAGSGVGGGSKRASAADKAAREIKLNRYLKKRRARTGRQ